MMRSIQSLLCFLSVICLFTNCRKQEWDEMYGRPDWLANPIYQKLKEEGRFNTLIKVIDKSGYQNILGTAGYWTFFAPNDEAFAKFFQEKGITIDSVNQDMAAKIVKYALVYNSFRKDQLSGYQSSTGIIPNMAYKRETAYYDWVLPGVGKYKKIIATNRNGSFVSSDNNNKHIPYFLEGYFTARGLNSALDYNSFYPNTTFSGFNVADAKVLQSDIIAENGVVHELDKVVMPLDNLDSYLASNPEYSSFKSLLDSFMVSYVANADITTRYQALSGSADSVYVKLYSSGLGFSLNNENFIQSNTDSQMSGWTLVVPKNNVLDSYVNQLLSKFGSFAKAPINVLSDLLNAHMWQTTVWPSRLKNVSNFQGERPTFDLADIVDKKMLSNGIFYGTNKVQEANVFRTVYSLPYLDPEYFLMTRALNADLKFSIINPDLKYTLFMMSDSQLRAAGYDFSSTRNEWSYTAPGGTANISETSRNRMYRILQTSVVPTQLGELDNLAGEGIVEAWNGEYIKYKNNQVYASGNADTGTPVTVLSSENAVNGKVYYGNGILTFTEKNIGSHLEALAASNPSNFSHFFNFLKASPLLYTASTKDINGIVIGTFYTVLVPTNAAIESAIKQGILPGNKTTGAPPANFSGATSEDVDKIAKFLRYHFINKNTVVPDGKKSGTYETLLKTQSGDATTVTVVNQLNNMEIRDMYYGNPTTPTVGVKVVNANSNNLSNRTVIHSINNFLKYNDQ